MRATVTAGLVLFGVSAPFALRAQERVRQDTGIVSVSVSASGTANSTSDSGTSIPLAVPAAVDPALEAPAASALAVPGVQNSFQGYRANVQALVSFKYDPPSIGRVKWQVGLSSGLRKYDTAGFLPVGDSLFASASSNVTGRLAITASESLTYSPNYRLGYEPAPNSVVDPAQAAADSAQLSTNLELGLTRTPYYAVGTSVTANYNVAQHSSIVANYSGQRSHFVDGDATGLNTQNAHLSFRQQLTKYAAFHAGYGRRLGEYTVSAGSPARVHDIDIGIDGGYAHPMTIGRHATLSFGSGSSIVTDGINKGFGLTGNATLTYAIGRRTQASLSFNRALHMQPGVSTPAFTNGTTGALVWQPHQRLNVSVSFTASSGAQVGSTGSSGSLTAHSGVAMVSSPITRNLRAFAQYVNSQQSVGVAVDLQRGIPRQSSRQAVMFGVTASMSRALIHTLVRRE